MARNPDWSREELIIAFNLYCTIPFTKINARYQPVIDLGLIIGRSNNAVAMKLANFARLDPVLQARGVKGLKGGGDGEKEIWNEFNGNWDALSYESELLLAKYKKQPLEVSAEIDVSDLPREGKEREAIVKLRVNQNFFRKAILSSYQTTCCITGIKNPDLLIASHILPWSESVEHRVNPANGLCLNSLHDKAFDKYLITITPDYKIKLSERLKAESDNKIIQEFFLKFEEQKIILPKRFLPHNDFLLQHNKCFAERN